MTEKELFLQRELLIYSGRLRISRHAGPPFHRKPGRGFTACRAGVSAMPGQYVMTGPSRGPNWV
jgi:hypothetical protein